MYTLSELFAEVIKMLSSKTPEEASVDTRRFQKNTGAPYTGLMTLEPDISINPNMNLNYACQEYISDSISFNSICTSFIKEYKEKMPKRVDDSSALTDFSNAKNKIIYTPVIAKDNKELLERIPHRLVLDLAIVYRIYLEDKSHSNSYSTILIDNEIMQLWDTTEDALYELARRNNIDIFSWSIDTMNEVIKKLTKNDPDIRDYEIDKMLGKRNLFVLGNRKGLWAAASVLIDYQSQACLGRMIADDYYVLPISIHEIILVAEKSGVTVDELKAIMQRVILKYVNPKDALNDKIYFYDRRKALMTIIE